MACENMQPGLLRMLYIIGQCSPGQAQLRWITQLMRQITLEGLAHGWVMADSLDMVHAFEVDGESPLPEPQRGSRYRSSFRRAISILRPKQKVLDLNATIHEETNASIPT